MKVKFILICCLSFLSLFALFNILPVNGEEEVYDNMIRLHVLANSDSDEDQALKLKVRDAILKEAETIKASNAAEAYIKTEGCLKRFENTAKSVLKEEGSDYSVKVTLGKEKYPERTYDGFTLPEGTYTSLRILIGEAEGQNWWCVLYPPLCTASASKKEEHFIAAGFTEDQYRVITQSEKKTFRIKFKIVEIFKDIFE